MEDAKKILSVSLLVSALFLSATMTMDRAVALSWNIHTVDSVGNVGEYTSIAVDSEGNPHISYWDRDNWALKYACWNGSAWNITTVDSSSQTGLYSSIALDSNDRPHIAYFNQGEASVMHANWTGSSWNIERVEWNWSAFVSIDIDGLDNPHVSWYDSSVKALRYAHWTGSSWNIETVESGTDTGTWSSLKTDKNDEPHIAYRDTSGGLRYAKKSGPSWLFKDVDTVVAAVGVSLALSNDESPRISYRDRTNASLKFAKFDGANWIVDVVDWTISWGDYSSLAIDSLGNARIAYNDGTNGDLGYVYWNGTSWKKVIVDSQDDVGITPSLALSANGTAHISYRDETNQALKYARVFGVPSAPTGLVAVQGDARVTLSWQAADMETSPITNYRIYRGTTPGGETFLMEIGNVLTYTDTNVRNGQTYYYQITAKNAVGEGPRSNEVSATPMTVPGAPTGLIAVAGNRQVTLTWAAPEDDGGSPITHYRIYRGTLPGNRTFLTEIGDVLSYTDTGLTNGVIYYYTVAAVNNIGHGPNSTEASATPATRPSEPMNLQATAGNNRVTLTWNPPASDGGSEITNYRIYRGNASGDEVLLTTLGNVLTYTDTNVRNGQTYYYWVSAVNVVGEGAQSPEVVATPSSPPGKSVFEEVWFWLLIVVVVIMIIIVLVAVLLLARRTRRWDQEPPIS
ncbi:MAG: fibronectin type III domain-containing protein [Thermoplasmata archaeon]